MNPPLPSREELAAHIKTLILAARSEQATAQPSSIRQIDSTERWLERLREVRQNATILGFSQTPVRRSVHHVLWSILEQAPAAPECDLPPDLCAHILVIRTAAIGVFDRLLARFPELKEDAFLSVVCHRKDEAVFAQRLAPERRQLLPYPRFEAYAPAELRRVIGSADRSDWQAIVILDNSSGGTGKDLPHIAAALTPWFETPIFVFNAGGRLHANPFSGLLGNGRDVALIRDLMAYLDRSATLPQTKD